MAPRLWLLCGLAFAGKTTVRREIVELTGAVVVCPDDINAERGLWGGDGIPDEEWSRTHEIASGRADEALASGRDVVVDDTMCYRWLRDDYREVASRHGATTRVIVCDVPIGEIRERMRRNETSGDRRSLRADVIQRLVEVFEWPGDDEETVTAEAFLAELRRG